MLKIMEKLKKCSREIEGTFKFFLQRKKHFETEESSPELPEYNLIHQFTAI